MLVQSVSQINSRLPQTKHNNNSNSNNNNNKSNNNNNVTCRLGARIVEDGKTSTARLQQLTHPAIAGKWLRKHVSLATDMHTQKQQNSWKLYFLWGPHRVCVCKQKKLGETTSGFCGHENSSCETVAC
jgi:hypothetical protein